MWQADSQVGMVVLKAPEIPKVDHPITLVVEDPKETGPPQGFFDSNIQTTRQVYGVNQL